MSIEVFWHVCSSTNCYKNLFHLTHNLIERITYPIPIILFFHESVVEAGQPAGVQWCSWHITSSLLATELAVRICETPLSLYQYQLVCNLNFVLLQVLPSSNHELLTLLTRLQSKKEELFALLMMN
ncbi:hypothetical protein L6452_40672 [Arctium lappa]|uniref:Uncharacterized protein n=1 Tax=Arctium lappa TaxID=4217 RepID=A0ACB8XNA8_ARCLA|nr:hypothetical protein L6452_40672 [Arctium lappa]